MSAFYSGRTVLVTGASGGIGAEMARQLGAAGARVLLSARSHDALARVAADVEARGGTARVALADLQAPDGPRALLTAVADETIDVLVNNAGYGVLGEATDVSEDDTDGMVALNVAALTTLTRRLLPAMRERRRGGVLNVASVAAFQPAPHFAVYGATKAYVLSFTEALHAELDGTGVHASALCPGPVATGFGERAGMDGRFFTAGTSAADVARTGLEGLAANTRRVIPGAFNQAQVALSALTPTGVTLRAVSAIMRRATTR